tara:strand:+ start:447 stop:1715 length:1269 start_codon:yes stop_codon:yes gene_type:complete
MALSFSRSLLAGLTNPNFGDIEGLGKQIGSAKAMSDRRSMLLGMMDSPVDLANLAVSDAARTGDAATILQATQARTSVIQDQVRRELGKDEARRLAASTEEEKMAIEADMARKAAAAGLDASKITGRTQSEIDEQFRVDAAAKERRRQQIASTYFSLDPDQTVLDVNGNEVSAIELFEENVGKAGFGEFLSRIKTERARNDKFNDELQAEQESLEKPLPIQSAIDSLANLPPRIQEQLKKRLEDIKQPDFAAGGTWSSVTERRQARETLKLINQEILRYTIRQEVDKAGRIETLEREIRRVEKIDPSKVTAGQRDTQIEAAIDELMKEDPPAFGKSLGFSGFTPDEPDLNNRAHREMIDARATELAAEAAGLDKTQTLDNLRSDLAALQGPAEEGDEKKNNDVETGAETLDVRAQADAIIGE